MFLKQKIGVTLALSQLFVWPAAAQSPEFRSDNLPGTTIHRASEQMFSSDVIELKLAPKDQTGSRLEYKVHMGAGDALLYALSTSAPIVSEFHGEADSNGAVMFYREESSTSESNGQFVAPMTGVHGWYLANEQDIEVTVRLTFAGRYTINPGLIAIR